ncbi:hypothetical protein J9253_05925 [Thiothrix litoralis]|uniref:Uncharacterized protein n=1 Tax=Thiothrix litoralis TaxID=2891210 RepID=A0ABX7WUV8_9GAMM|nr:hypothetical protein [Thiothrix litoralis]QTR47470.1 hypothetical protein J9253_05925 [Thiothrix litoralis]
MQLIGTRDCYGSRGNISASPPVINRPVMTRQFTPLDYCQFIIVGGESEEIVSVPFDPNTNQKAQFAVMTPMRGDYAVSLTGATDFSNLGVNGPLLNPVIFPLDNLHDFRVYSVIGTMLKICWYLDNPNGVKFDRPPIVSTIPVAAVDQFATAPELTI